MQKCVLVKKGSKGQCVCAKRLSYEVAQNIGVDWNKLPSFVELCHKAGLKKIMIGSTITTTDKIINKYRKQLGGLDMPERMYKYPLIEGEFDDIELWEGIDDFEDSGNLGQLTETIKEVLPSFNELKELLKGVGGMAGAFFFNSMVIDRFITPDKWILQSLVKAGSGLLLAKLLVKKVDPSVGVGYGLYSLWDAFMSVKDGIKQSRINVEQQPQLPEQPTTEEKSGGEQTDGFGQMLLRRDNEYLLGTEMYRAEEFEDTVMAITPEEAIDRYY